VEVRARRRLDAVLQLAVVALVEVELQDLLLAVLLRQPVREHDLFGLALIRLARAQELLLDELLGDRRPAAHDLAGPDVGQSRPDDPARVEARVRPERLVLDRDRPLDELRRDVVERDVHPVAALIPQVGEERAPAVVDARVAAEVRGVQPVYGGEAVQERLHLERADRAHDDEHGERDRQLR
jgi:hypothetical protein